MISTWNTPATRKIMATARDIDRRAQRPVQQRHRQRLPKDLAPDVAEHHEQNHADRRRIDERQPTDPDVRKIAHEKRDRADEHDQSQRQQGNDDVAALLLLCRAHQGTFPQERIDRHAVQIGQAAQHQKVGHAVAALPFGNGFIRIIQLFGKLRLGQPCAFPIGGDLLRKDGSYTCFFHLYILNALNTVFSTPGREPLCILYRAQIPE